MNATMERLFSKRRINAMIMGGRYSQFELCYTHVLNEYQLSASKRLCWLLQEEFNGYLWYDRFDSCSGDYYMKTKIDLDMLMRSIASEIERRLPWIWGLSPFARINEGFRLIHLALQRDSRRLV